MIDIFARCSFCGGILGHDESSYVYCINTSCPKYKIPMNSKVAPITRSAQAESVVEWMSEDERHIYRNRKPGETMAEAAERLDKEKGEKASDLDLVRSALSGSIGPSQQRIAQVGLDWIATLIKKNTDYGDSAWTEPVLAPNLPPKQAILVRMSDKINRLKALSQKEALVAESYNDTMKDLGAYALLYLAAPETK